MANKMPDYAHADPCRQEMRSVYVFDLFVSRPSAPDLSTKLAQLDFKAAAAPAHLTEVNVGVFFEQASPSPAKHLPAPHPRYHPTTRTHALTPRTGTRTPSRTLLTTTPHT